MKILSKMIVSNSDMTKNYRGCRDKAEDYGKIVILKNNQPDAVMFSITEYERYSVILEYLEKFNDKDFEQFIESHHMGEN